MPAPRPLHDRTRGAAADPRHDVGRLGEELAAQHLVRRGLRLLARNVRTRAGEIDIVACDGRALVFVEVKTLRIAGAGAPPERELPEPLAALRPRQRARLRRLAAAWLSQRARPRPHAETIRFDAIGVVLDERSRLLRLEHLEGAW